MSSPAASPNQAADLTLTSNSRVHPFSCSLIIHPPHLLPKSLWLLLSAVPAGYLLQFSSLLCSHMAVYLLKILTPIFFPKASSIHPFPCSLLSSSTG